MIKKITSVFLFCFITTFLFAGERSSEWNKVRKEHLKVEPVCQICKTMKSLQVHHKQPFHLFPELELRQDNLITVCTSRYWGFNCHFDVAHAGNFKYYNPWIDEDTLIILYIVDCNDRKITPTTQAQIEDYLKFIHKRTKEFNEKLKIILQDPAAVTSDGKWTEETLNKIEVLKEEISEKYTREFPL